MQGLLPLSLDFMADPAELTVAVVQGEVLVEAAQHHRAGDVAVRASSSACARAAIRGCEPETSCSSWCWGCRIRAKRPLRSTPQTCLKPRNSKVSGLCPCLPRWRRRSVQRAASESFLGQFQIEPREPLPHWRWKFSASSGTESIATKSSAKRTRYASPRHCGLNFFSNHRSSVKCR